MSRGAVPSSPRPTSYHEHGTSLFPWLGECVDARRTCRRTGVVFGREEAVMGSPACRSCLGGPAIWCSTWATSPRATIFRPADDPGPDPGYPLQMWLCSSCGLAQLVGEPTVAEEPRGTEPAALVAQAVDAVERLDNGGVAVRAKPGSRVRQSPRRLVAGPVGRPGPRTGGRRWDRPIWSSTLSA